MTRLRFAGGAARLRRRTVLAVFAHPDDESLACGGTLARLSDLGATVVVLCASRGELGFVAEPSLVADGDVGRARSRELLAAGRALGVRTVHILAHPDGNVRWDGGVSLGADVYAAIERHRPDAVITFDRDGLYWHADHLGVHEETSRVVGSLGSCGPDLYYVTMAPGVMSRLTALARQKSWVPPAGGLWSLDPTAFGAARPTPTFSVDARPWIPRKLAALQCHRTQMGSVNPFSMLDPLEARQLLGVEYFRRAPDAGRGAPLLEVLAEPPKEAGAARAPSIERAS